MNNRLKEKIEKVRLELQNESFAMVIGNLNEGMNCLGNIALNSYYEFLNVCNGARCGAIDLWSNELLFGNQYRVMELVGDVEKWLCIGQVLYEPIVMKRDTEEVYLFYQGFENEIEGKCFGKLDDFLDNYVFGRKYAKIIPNADEEEWYIFLEKIKII